ncbi:hypothetical protein [Polaromonas sp. OV174]|uniref:hypothetical protein n=1 Tax=Polaromonas sp. OV174 TaxID=1855300 RepID=UPI001C42F4B3|nr:hypothetical protein [Polaromonas sp. OV174]
MAIVKHKASLKTIKSERLAKYVTQLEASDKWTLDYCQALSQLSDCATDISCQA